MSDNLITIPTIAPLPEGKFEDAEPMQFPEIRSALAEAYPIERGQGYDFDAQFVLITDAIRDRESIAVPAGDGPVRFEGEGEPIDIAARVLGACLMNRSDPGDLAKGEAFMRRILEALQPKP